MSLESTLRTKVVDPLFKRVPPSFPKDVPAAIARNREKRARQRVIDALAARGVADVPPELTARLEEVVVTWSARGFVDSFAAAEDLELECAREGERRAAEGDSPRMHALLEAEHRAWVLGRYAKVEIRGLQLSHRVMQALDDTYVPLYVTDPEARSGSEIEALLAERARIPVADLLTRHARTLIIGPPGSGKSTLVAWLATQHARGSSVVPFVVVARSVGEAPLGIREIAAQANKPEAFVEACVMSGRALVLVDGLDEVRDGAAFQRSVERFVAAFPSCPVVATSRPAGCEAIAGFTSATLTPMTRDEVTTFVDRWCKSAELSVQSDAESAVLAAERAAEDLKGRIRSSRPVERLAENPLMCGVICIVHRFLGERIPERRAALYEACTNVLLYEWDRAKFPAGAAIGALDAQDKRFLLGELALQMHEQKVAEIAEADVCAAIERRLPELKGAVANSRTRATEIIAEIRDRSGLLVERSPGKFGFSHLSFQEYLAATELVRERKTAVLVSHAKEEWWGEVIVLAAGLPGADAQELIRGLLRADRSAPKVGIDRALILAALCLDSAVSVPVALRREVEGRIAPFVPPRSAKGVERLEPFGELLVPLLLRAFDGADAQAKAYTAILLRVLHAEAGIVKIATMLPGPFSAAAIITLARWARDSALAQRTLLATIRERTSVLEETRHLSKGSNDIAAILALHDAATKAPPSQPPKRAARTG